MRVTNELIKLDERSIGMSTRASYFPIVAKSAKGVVVKDLEGRQFIDMISSACVVNTGYNHDRIVKAVKTQLDECIHFANDYFYTEPQVKLANELFKITPGNFEKKAIFGFSGSDSIDSAIKASRAYTGRTKLVSFIGAYHGSTYGALSVSAIDLNMKRKMGPMLPDVYHIKYPLMTEIKEGESEEDYGERKFEEFLENFKYYLPAEEVAAILMEPIIGDLGLILPPKRFMKRLREFCDEHGILFVVDEIQQGFGRTGKWFSIEHFDVVPDLVVMGKAMASGLPMSAVVGRSEVIDSIGMPGQLFTLQGNPVISSAALETIEIIKSEGLLERAVEVGEYVVSRFKDISVSTGVIRDIRGLGLTIGVELCGRGSDSATDVVKKICYRCYEKGLILIYLGGNTLRVQPPLVISDDEIKTAMDIIESVFKEYETDEIDDSILEKIKGW